MWPQFGFQRVFAAARFSGRNTGIRTSARCLHATRTLLTDGVYKDLTSVRVQVPWIEALRSQRAGKQIQESEEPEEVPTAIDKSKPKKMSDSSHKIVGVCNTTYSDGLPD